MTSPAEFDAMRHAISLSALGLGSTSPNPPVGCVVLDRIGRLVGTGYHLRKGEAHAETQALAMAGARACGGTAVVTLEPCNHAGLTPACRQALLDAQVARVVIALLDPTSRDGGGAATLAAAGIDIEVGVLADEARQVLEPWLTSTLRRRPYVTWAYAATEVADASSFDLVEDLRNGVDLVVHVDGRAEEGIPGAHGKGMLKIPSMRWDLADPESKLSAIFGDGARSVLVVGTSPLGKTILEHGLVDRIVVELPRTEKAATSPLPSGFHLRAVTPTRTSLRLVADQMDPIQGR